MAAIPSDEANTNMNVIISLKDVNGNPLRYKDVRIQFRPYEQLLVGIGPYVMIVTLQTDMNGLINTVISFYSINNKIDMDYGVVATFDGDDEYKSATVNLTKG